MIERIRESAREMLAQNDDTHGYHHSERVEILGHLICEHEGGDKLIVSAASYLHDMYAHKGREYHISEPALDDIRNELITLQFPEDKIPPTINVIRHHEDYSSDRKQLIQECLNFQDADRLDAIGAVGIARCFYSAASLSYPFGTPADMHELAEQYHVGQLTSAIQHFYTKLLHIKDNMNTGYGRQLAQERHDFMVEFLRRFKLEWSGEI